MAPGLVQTEDYEVEVGTEPFDALTRLLDSPPDLLMLDLMMPDLDGFELLKLLRLDPRGAHVPVLIISARTGHQDQILSLQLGADAYVCKPFSPRDLLKQVRELIERREESAGE